MTPMDRSARRAARQSRRMRASESRLVAWLWRECRGGGGYGWTWDAHPVLTRRFHLAWDRLFGRIARVGDALLETLGGPIHDPLAEAIANEEQRDEGRWSGHDRP